MEFIDRNLFFIMWLDSLSLSLSLPAVFVSPPTERESVAQGLFWWVQAQVRSPHVYIEYFDFYTAISFCEFPKRKRERERER